MTKLAPEVGLYANLHLFSDVEPYEIVRIISDKTIELRSVTATLKPDWKPDMIPGGFAAHTANNHTQEYDYKTNPDAYVFKARLRKKDGRFHSARGRHVVSEAPCKFHDYNF